MRSYICCSTYHFYTDHIFLWDTIIIHREPTIHARCTRSVGIGNVVMFVVFVTASPFGSCVEIWQGIKSLCQPNKCSVNLRIQFIFREICSQKRPGSRRVARSMFLGNWPTDGTIASVKYHIPNNVSCHKIVICCVNSIVIGTYYTDCIYDSILIIDNINTLTELPWEFLWIVLQNQTPSGFLLS